jgi:hypothetical protein
MLHATGLVVGDRALLLMAPHNTGKSTTALRLVLAGYRLLSDSHIYAAQYHDGLLLTGFPVGRIKLRQDMAAEFPQLQPLLTPEAARDETKYVVDLRRLLPERVCAEAVYPARLDLCLLSRSNMAASRLTPAHRAEIEEAVMLNSLHYDPDEVWTRNLAILELLLDRCQLHRLSVGSDPAGIVAAVSGE